ncbi:EpsG family protein [Acinetobacter pittii]|uniref:EpsG family protein n=2 Tax=Acinetobacter TaxID=469 RepID=UPI000A39D448|nr:EpsG family protein [Acinetobacter pittii]MCZ1179757.1 EpsG family protein [Acinetobacter pittii]OTU23676.1 hypothetical protein CAT62_01530 [Acinetobacter pittii]OTU48480.1 hypothetical protein CAT36_19075 [Acinetobacter pittii]
MLPYILLLVLLISVVFVESFSLGRKAFWLPALFLIFFASIRSSSVGTDTVNYTYNFERSLNSMYYDFNNGMELGYQLLEYIILTCTDNYFWLFLISSIVVVLSYLITIKKLSINYFYSIFIFITFGFYTFFFNGLRQGLAMSICFLGLPYLLEKRIIPYFTVVFIASMFHISALIMIPIYLLVNARFRLEYKVIACFIISILASQVLIGYLAQGNKRYEHYTQEVDQAGGYITLLFYSLIGLVVYFSSKKNRSENIYFNKFEQIFLCGLALMFPIALLGTDPSGPQRILYYFTSMCIFLIPYILKKYNSILINILFVLFSVIYFSMITMRFGDLYPYQINPIFEVF